MSASIRAKRLNRYGASEALDNLIELLALRHEYASCENVIQALGLGKEDIADVHGVLARQAVNDGKWEDAWNYLKSCKGDGNRWDGWRMRICEHWLQEGALPKCIELLDSVESPYGRGLIALHLAARCKGLPGATALDVVLRSDAGR